jgi:hypothetical protein
MAGFLEYLMNPAAQGMLNMSAGLLQAGGPSRMPVSFGQALGQGLQQGTQGVMAAQQMQNQQQRNQLQQKMIEAQMAEMQRKANSPIVAPPGSQLLRPGADTPFHTVPFAPRPEAAAPGPQSPLGKLAADLQAGLITKEQFDEQFKRMTAPPAPLVQMPGAQQETAFQKRVGTEMGDQYANLLKADMNAPATIGKYQRLGSLLGQVQTGKFKGATTDIKAAAKGLGIDLTALGVADDVAPAQAARALSNQIALELRNPAGGAGMPGALSDKDREFLIASIPGLENDPNAVGKMIEYRVKLAQREQEVAKKARAYRKKNGKFDEGFYDELQEWSAKNPLFPETKPTEPKAEAGGQTLTAAEAAELEQLRKRFKK